MKEDDRQIAVTHLPRGVCVSTMFLDLIYAPDAPRKWETLILGGAHNEEGERYTSAEDARAGHELWVMVAKDELTAEAIHEMRATTAS